VSRWARTVHRTVTSAEPTAPMQTPPKSLPLQGSPGSEGDLPNVAWSLTIAVLTGALGWWALPAGCGSTAHAQSLMTAGAPP